MAYSWLKTAKTGILALLATGVWSCSGVPSHVIAPKKMAVILADIHTGEAVVEQDRSKFSNDSAKQLLKQSIYARNGVTVEQVDRSLEWYGANVDRYWDVYKLTVDILEERLAAINDAAATNMEVRELVAFEAEGDSVDVWTLYRSRIFSPLMPNDRIAFEIASNRYWEQGDVYMLQFKVLNARHAFNVAMAAEYTDGHVSYTNASPSTDGWHSVQLNMDPDRSASVLMGLIAYPTDSVLDRFPTVHTMIDSIQLVRVRKNSFTVPAIPGEGTQHSVSLR